MKEELYINGEAVDLDESVNITLNYKSNMLTDLSKIVGNNSYTIKLPKTQKNLGIIGCADMPGAVSSFPRVTHDARYFRNGVEIVSRGKAVLLAVNEAIEVVLTWGSTNALLRVVEDSKKLNKFGGISDYVDWNENTSASVYNAFSNVMFPSLYLGLNAINPGAALHPAVRSSYVFDLIKREYGLTLEFPDESKAFVESLIIPLLTRNGGYANRVNNMGTHIKNDLTDRGTIIKGGSDFDKVFKVETGLENLTTIQVLVDCTVVIVPTFETIFLGSAVQYGTESVLDNTIYMPYEVRNDMGLTVYTYSEPVKIDLKANDYFRVVGVYATSNGLNNAYYTFGAQPNEVQLGDRFPLVENLPDIKIVDFIKAVASMSGLFAIPSADGKVLKFVSFDSLGDRTRAVDWSDKVVYSNISERPKQIGYALDGFAQNNRMKYKEDDTVAMLADGNILIGDKTLDYERDAVVLPFAPSDGMMGRAQIKLYEYNDGLPELQDVEPRILIEKNEGGLSVGTFDGLHWSALINNYYSTYQNTIKTPVVITENVLLDEFTLRDMDLSIPIYLRQYGRYYAVVEVKAPSNGVCECKLLQLD